MGVILDPNVRTEVNYDKAATYMSFVLAQWRAVNTDGKRALITNIEDLEAVRNALQIIICAVEEREVIIKEYVESFGYEGIDVYNELISNISENMKQSVPFINMRLRAWSKKLEEDDDGNIWANLSLLDFY